MAAHHPGLRLHVSRGSSSVLLNALREQRLDGAIVDLRSMVPSADLKVTQAFDLGAGLLVRPGHPLAHLDRPVLFQDLLAYPVASTPLSDEVARMLVARYGPRANPEDMLTLRCDETLNLVELARSADVVRLTVNAMADDLVRLDVSPVLDATARFGFVTLNGREEAPSVRIVSELLAKWVLDLA
jgi:DNA-binding transcriptional LysR family regulator